MVGYVMRQFTCPKAVTHPSTNRARCRATALIETNALPLHGYTKPPTRNIIIYNAVRRQPCWRYKTFRCKQKRSFTVCADCGCVFDIRPYAHIATLCSCLHVIRYFAVPNLPNAGFSIVNWYTNVFVTETRGHMSQHGLA